MSRRLVFSHIVPGAKCSAKVYRDAETYGYLVRFFMHGVHHVPADYETDTQEEAIGTAQHEVDRINAQALEA